MITAPESTSPTIAAPLVAPTTTSQTSPTTSSGDAASTPTATTLEATFARLIPNFDGVLYAAVDGGSTASGMRLLEWLGDRPPLETIVPKPNGPGVEFDALGTRLAFIGNRDAGGLFVGFFEDFNGFRTGVTSFAWHRSRPGELAWAEADVLCHGSADQGDVECFEYEGGELIGYDDLGYLIRTDSSVRLLDTAGATTGEFTAEDAEIGPEGRVLLIDTDDSGDRHFDELSIRANELRPLPWAPLDALGDGGFVSWSPVAPLLAFLRYTPDGEWLVSVFYATGAHLMTKELPGRFWDVAWDTSGVHVVAPGETDDHQSIVAVLNILTGDLALFPHPDTVQDVELATGRCIDATPIAANLTDYLVARAGSDLPRPRAVLSLDPDLESWLFVSGEVSDGPRHGEIATWALPGYGFSPEAAQLGWFLPMNDVAEDVEPGISNPYSPEEYGFDDWMAIEGALESQLCAGD